MKKQDNKQKMEMLNKKLESFKQKKKLKTKQQVQKELNEDVYKGAYTEFYD